MIAMTCLRRHCRLALALLLLPSGPQAASQAQPAPADPFPLRRIVIPQERIPSELERQGVLVQMPRADFEAKVRQATQAQKALRQQPRLIKAIYTAELNGQALIGGSGQWTVYNAGVAPAVLPIPLLNLAIHKMRLGNADAVLGKCDGKSLGLWIPGEAWSQTVPRQVAVYFDWSLRGQAQADGIAFEMRVPACVMCILEVKLPADRVVLLDRQVGMVSGPFETEKAGQKLWRVQATGRSQVEFIVRRNNLPTTAPMVFTTLESRQELVAGA
ncbi:MAG: hypothetical protein AAB289_07620, partial [Chloroflexota bacterium]